MAGIFDKIFPRPKKQAADEKFFQLFSGYTPVYTSQGGAIYEKELIRAAIHTNATNCSKLSPELHGEVRKDLEIALKHRMNPFMTTSQFLYRLSTILFVENTAFIVPVEDQFGRLTGYYPVLPSSAQMVESRGTQYLRYWFGSGQTTAVEWEKVGVLTRYQYDNDIFGTDVTFGFHTAVDIATDVIDRLHTTAASHSRILVCEIMGNKAGWLTLNAGIAGGADVIIIPEIPYDIDKVCEAVLARSASGKTFSILAVAEGAFDVAEAKMKKKERAKKRSEAGIVTATSRIAAQIQANTGMEARVCVPGHMLRGGAPSAYDRVLSTQFGVHAAHLIAEEKYGRTVAKVGNKITSNSLDKIAGKTKFVDPDDNLVTAARDIGVSFGD